MGPAGPSGGGGSSQVLLVSLPFGILNSPSLGLGILQARLRAAGIDARSRYFTIDYAARIGLDGYARVAAGFPRTTDLLGEWIFSHAVSPATGLEQQSYLTRTLGLEPESVLSAGPGATLAEDFRRLAEEASAFCDEAAREIVVRSPRVVCFTTVFQQTMASVAVAARLRKLDPSIRTVIGGANCEGPMGQELARRYPVFDAVVSGEADLLIAPLVGALLDGESLTAALEPHAESVCGPFVQARMVSDLDRGPAPAFDDFFEDLGRLGDQGPLRRVQVPLETSRGCWWGVKHHCTFCGLNGSTMSFRSKSPDVALREILATAERYPEAKICFVDNIMDHRYFDTLLPRLAEVQPGVDLFYEINSNVTKEQVRALKAAGVSHIQPGIESLSDQVLGLMRKGVRAIQNLQLLKWCAELGLAVDWNVLWGFPGEDPAEYARLAALMPLISHLPPPARGSRLRLDRFSPNFTSAAALGFYDLRPYPAYLDVHRGLPADAVFNLAYFFEADSAAESQIDGYTASFAQALERWKAAHGSGGLMHLGQDDALVLIDSRPLVGAGATHELSDLQSRLYRFCDSARSRAAAVRAFPEARKETIADRLDDFCDRGLMWSDGERYLSLALSFADFLAARQSQALLDAIGEMLSEAPRRPQAAG
jgi:ribosomal peptide maturation radical SAM protein 1